MFLYMRFQLLLLLISISIVFIVVCSCHIVWVFLLAFVGIQFCNCMYPCSTVQMFKYLAVFVSKTIWFSRKAVRTIIIISIYWKCWVNWYTANQTAVWSCI